MPDRAESTDARRFSISSRRQMASSGRSSSGTSSSESEFASRAASRRRRRSRSCRSSSGIPRGTANESSALRTLRPYRHSPPRVCVRLYKRKKYANPSGGGAGFLAVVERSDVSGYARPDAVEVLRLLAVVARDRDAELHHAAQQARTGPRRQPRAERRRRRRLLGLLLLLFILVPVLLLLLLLLRLLLYRRLRVAQRRRRILHRVDDGRPCAQTRHQAGSPLNSRRNSDPEHCGARCPS